MAQLIRVIKAPMWWEIVCVLLCELVMLSHGTYISATPCGGLGVSGTPCEARRNS